jgi:hypothetical protein
MSHPDQRHRLEIKKLKQDTSLWARLSSVLWPVVASLFTVVIGCATWQSTRQETKREYEQKERQFVSAALKDATDSQSGLLIQVTGLWQLNASWK